MTPLDASKPQSVKYAIPLWLRDEQIKHALTRVSGRVSPVDEARAEPIAIVGYGPTLRDTWEKIRDFKFVMSCSGAHKFLLEQGITPTWHSAVDPLPGPTVQLIGTPHPEVEYLISSTCHKAVFDLLEGFKVKLWHVFDSTAEGIRTLPHGEWAITGGCDIGLRSLTLASFLGFREMHVFGLDGCAPAEGKLRHAGAHPHGLQKYSPVDFDGRTFWTTPAMLEAARQTVHELQQMPAVKATFYGDGLTQAMVKGYVPTKKNMLSNIVGFTKPELISVEYRKLNAELHATNPAYGVGGEKHAETILKIAEGMKTKNILDYGCGKGRLAKALPFQIAEYDPAIAGKDESPKPADLVVCTDVLEHIEPEKIDFVLSDLQRVTSSLGYFVIHTGPSSKKLADGRNAHVLQRSKGWWTEKLEKLFMVPKVFEVGPLLYVVVAAKKKKKKKQKPLPPQPLAILTAV